MTDSTRAAELGNPERVGSPDLIDAPWLVALDIDGTTMHEDGTISDHVLAEIDRLDRAGHEVMLATGRSAAATLPVLTRLGITPRYLVCSNGAVTLAHDPSEPSGYRREWTESFDPTDVLTTMRSHLDNARFAVEDEQGHYRFTEVFPDDTIGDDSERVDFEELLVHPATRVVVISPDHQMEEFLAVVDRMGLHRVSYAIGWTAWLDIAPDGVNKSTALERVRLELDIPRSRILAVGDGRNDIDMLLWAGQEGRGVAMGQSPDDVIAVASEITAPVQGDGLAQVLATL
ncbi:HAD family hydrolase [Leifsonia kafniensis]|uniref:HAD family hydrolase n=1 Tax=Leifsonia kafniensis TaxID=475957 RepID=A0ABP7KKD3_9MICO